MKFCFLCKCKIKAICILLQVFLPSIGMATCNPNMTSTRPDSRYEGVVGSGGAEVKDKITGLIWQRCSYGRSWTGSACSGTANLYTWTQALEAARTANVSAVAPSLPWRVPNRNELLSLIERACYSPAVNSAWFDAAGYTWTSSSLIIDSSSAWFVNFTGGDDHHDFKTNTFSIRLVRFSQ